VNNQTAIDNHRRDEIEEAGLGEAAQLELGGMTIDLLAA
jgi:hypothetical protein